MACNLLLYIQEVKFLFQSGKIFLASFRLNDGQTKNAHLVLKCLVWWHTQNFKRCWSFNKSQTWYNIVLHVIYLHCLFGILLVYRSCTITKQLHLYIFSSNASEKENTYQNKCNVFKMCMIYSVKQFDNYSRFQITPGHLWRKKI